MAAEAGRRVGGRRHAARRPVPAGQSTDSLTADPGGRLPARLHIALIEPQIPPNTGNIARLCAATDTPLHLIEPLGFSIDDRHVRRAGLDYWEKVDLWVHPGWRDFRDAIARERCLYFSANATRDLSEARFRPNSCLIFGNETDGMPARILEKHPRHCFRIPMPGPVRSLNLANAVSVVLYEGLRRLGLDVPDEQLLPDEPDDA
ncbi:MAG: tRNA (cytidine(34)-2'-O)-methyltransferase [Gemmatimonadales bacterium]